MKNAAKARLAAPDGTYRDRQKPTLPGRAVLYNKGNVRLGELTVGFDEKLIEFGGAFFKPTEDPAVLDRDARFFGQRWVQTKVNRHAATRPVISYYGKLDIFEPRKGRRVWA